MIIRFKKLHPDAFTPTYSREGDAAVDFVAIDYKWDNHTKTWNYSTGIALEIPKGYVGLIYPRSSLSLYDLMLTNHVGVIDSNYRGEIVFRFKQLVSDIPKVYEKSNRIGQLIIQPIPEMSFVEVEELTPSNRGAAGFGSSGV